MAIINVHWFEEISERLNIDIDLDLKHAKSVQSLPQRHLQVYIVMLPVAWIIKKDTLSHSNKIKQCISNECYG